jgi:hypothetical protein
MQQDTNGGVVGLDLPVVWMLNGDWLNRLYTGDARGQHDRFADLRSRPDLWRVIHETANGKPVCLDIDSVRVPGSDRKIRDELINPGSDSIRDARIKWLRDIHACARRSRPGINIGTYGMPGGEHDWDRDDEATTARRVSRLKYARDDATGRIGDFGLADTTNTWYPSIYVQRDVDPATARFRSVEMVERIARLYDTPICPFVWAGEGSVGSRYLIEICRRLKPLHDSGVIESFVLWRIPHDKIDGRYVPVDGLREHEQPWVHALMEM